MSMLDALIGPVALVVGLIAVALGVAATVLRERRGPAPRTTTLPTSRPLLTAAFVVTALCGAILLVLRLGVLS